MSIMNPLSHPLIQTLFFSVGAAKSENFNSKAADFSIHAEQLCRVAEVATDVGCDQDPHRHDNIKLSIEALRNATPLVVYSGKTLSLNPNSEVRFSSSLARPKNNFL